MESSNLRLEESLRDSEEKYRRLVETTGTGYVILDEQGRVSDANREYVRLTGRRELDEVVGHSVLEWTAPQDLERNAEEVRKCVEQGFVRNLEIDYVSPTGRLVPVEIDATALCSSGTLQILALCRDITDRKLAEEALRQSEAKYQTLVEQSVQGLIIIEGQRIVFANSAFADISGYPVEELQSLSPDQVTALIHPDDQALVWGNFRNRLAGKAAPPRYQYRGVRKEGSVCWLEMAAGRITWFGKPAIQCSIIDITERKRAEAALLESEQRFRILAEASFEGIAITEQGVIIDCNDQLARMFGCPRSELVGNRVMEFIASEHRDLVAEAQRSGRLDPYEHLMRRPDGTTFPVEVRARSAQIGGRPMRITAIRDITERKLAEEALNHSHRLMRYIIEHNRSAIAVHDRDMRYVYVSRRYLDDYKVKEKDVIGKHHYDVFPDLPQKWREVHRKALAGEISSAEDDPYERDDGSLDWTRWECRPWYEAEGSIGGLIVYTEVITERKRVEEALRSSLEEKESLLREVHHRVKNNLQVISSLLSLQFRQVKNAEVRSFLRDTQNRIRSMATLHEILYRSGTVAKINFPDYVQGLCVHLARSYDSAARSIRLRQEIAPVALNLDQSVTAGLIINELVTNAFKHAFPSRSGGEILVALEAVDEGHLLLRVSDDGVGLPPEKPPQSAETLGLLLVENLTRQLEGRLSIGSGSETVFEIIFPRSPIERGSE